MTVIDPLVASRSTELVLVDLRPTTERHCGLGFIPGSIGLPLPDDPSVASEQLDALDPPRLPVLVCTSGARARAQVQRIGGRLERPLAYLDGGVLGWSAAGLPLCACAVPNTASAPIDPQELPRHLAACFVGELAEASLEHGLDPLALLRLAFERAGQSYDEPILDQLHRVLDHAALLSLELGTPLERVAANIDRMVAMLPEQSPSSPA